MNPSLITSNSSRARQPLSRENVTGLLRRVQDFFQIKIDNIYVFKLTKKYIKTSVKTGFAQIFSCCSKNRSCPKFWGEGGGGCSLSRLVSLSISLVTPARTPMLIFIRLFLQVLQLNLNLKHKMMIMIVKKLTHFSIVGFHMTSLKFKLQNYRSY